MLAFVIPLKLTLLTRITLTKHEKRILLSKVRVEAKRWLTLMLFNQALEYMIRKITVDIRIILLFRSTQIIAYVDNINVLVRPTKEWLKLRVIAA